MNTLLLHYLRLPFAAMIIGLVFSGCGENKAAVTPPADVPIPVKLQPVVTGNQGRILQYSGLIASNSEARLSFKIGGIISRIYVKEGDHVVDGQLLATLDLTEIDAQVSQATQNVEKAQRDEQRINNLYRDTVASLEQVQNMHTQSTVAKDALNIARFNRQYAQIRATSSGTILHKLMNEGEYASAGTAVLEFNGADQGDWVVRFGVSDKDWVILHKGDKANVSIDAYPDQRFIGQITKLAEGADATGGTYAVEVTVTAAGRKLAPGLFCTLQLQPAGRRAYTFIPASALAEGDGSTGYVYTVNADKRTVKKLPVHIAFLQDDLIAVSSGLDSVSAVIADGVGYLTERSVVKLISNPDSLTK
ncbi:efflux RND transporter periplasmic adaptor subunit [Puia dinghuensis]|uniref:RND transporter MFP subunit n=1 Tax=Puia dinghuensis TaxID=1792502 RepID=A0A8J2UEP9_9BACT|nr:efflux RND transporter periplasmic adaptor subunit [Puia dinghuensis]GGB05928.1 RND transporter MFP subunit [Puia dinghuensis]